MSLNYPSESPYNPYVEPKKPRNLPKIILLTLTVLIVVGLLVYFFMIKSPSDSSENDNQGIAVGEPNPNGYDCTRDIYNCGNFTTQSEAQVAFDSCQNQGLDDPWGLDKDGDGEVCEGL